MSIGQYHPGNDTVFHQWTQLGLWEQLEQLEQQEQKQPRGWKPHLSRLYQPQELELRLQLHSIHSSERREDSCSQQQAPSLLCRQQQLALQLLQLLGLLAQVQHEVHQHGAQEGWWLQP